MKKIILALLLISIVAFNACERNNMDPQINETEEFLSKIQNASLDEIYQFFGTNNSERIVIVRDAAYLKLAFNNKGINSDEIIIVVEDEYADNIAEAPRALFISNQTFEVVTGFFKKGVNGKEWSIYVTQDERIGNGINLNSGVLFIYSIEPSEKNVCMNVCMLMEFNEEWQNYLELGFFRRTAWWLSAPEMLVATYLDCFVDCHF